MDEGVGNLTFDYAAQTWSRVRWVIAKAEHTAMGSNPRFVITNSHSVNGPAKTMLDES